MNATIHDITTALTIDDNFLPDMICQEAVRFRNATAKLATLTAKRDQAYAAMRALSEEMSAALAAINEGKEPEGRDIGKIAADLKKAHSSVDKELDKYYAAMADIEGARDALARNTDVLKGLPLAANA